MKRNVRWALLIVWIITIFVLTGYPKIDMPKIKDFPIDKFYHFVVFFIMGFLAARLMKVRSFFVLGLLVVLLAEFQQVFIPGRYFEVPDIFAGIFAVVVSYFIFKQRETGNNVSKA